MKFVASLILAGFATATSCTTCQSETSTQPLSVPATKPSHAVVVAKDFVGFGMEAAYFPEFSQQFSVNLVNSLANHMSAPPLLRVGGTTGDYYTVNVSQPEARLCIKGPCTGTTAIFSLGPSYFNGFGMFKNAQWVVQAPLPSPPNQNTTLEYVSRAYSKVNDSNRIQSIALGNEVEFIYKSGVQSYVNAAVTAQDAIVKYLDLSGANAKVFEIGNTASSTIANGGGFTVGDILKTNITSDTFIKVAAEHWYQIGDNVAGDDSTMQKLMINHTAITQRFGKYLPDLTASKQAGIQYAIDEDAAVLGGELVFAGGFGYGLWAVDFNLVCMARGVDRVTNLAARPAAQRAFWNPGTFDGTTPPEVRAPYPSAILIADFIGKNDPTAVIELSTWSELTSAYAIYDNSSNQLQRVALVNLNLYNGTTGGTRGQQTFQIPVSGAKSLTVKRLHADLGVAALGYDHSGPQHNVTWAGQQWSYKVDQGNGHYPHGSAQQDTVQVQNGMASVVVPDSEAVIVFI